MAADVLEHWLEVPSSIITKTAEDIALVLWSLTFEMAYQLLMLYTSSRIIMTASQ